AALAALPAGKADEPAPVTRVTRSYWPKLFLTYSPDGSHFVYSRHHNNRRAANKVLTGLRIVRADGNGDRPLLPSYEDTVQIQEHPAWGPDGKRLYLSGGGNDTGNASKDAFVCDFGDDARAANLRKVLPDRERVTLGEQPVPSPDGLEIVFCRY